MKENKSYCPLAFTYIYSDSSNRYKLCSFSKQHPSFKRYDGKSPFEFFFSQEMEDIRNKMLSGERIEGCELCYAVEDEGYISNRQKFGNTETEITPNSLVLSLNFFGTDCNLSCYMCHPNISSAKFEELKSLESHVFSMQRNTFEPVDQRNIDNIIENIEYVKEIRFYGGEPFLLKSCWDLLDKIPKEYRTKIKIKFSTNLTKVNHIERNFDEYLEKFSNFKLSVSADHFGKKLAYIRYPIDVEQFEKNIAKYKHVIEGITVTASILNAMDLVEILEYYCSKFGFHEQQIYFNCVKDPEPLSVKNLPEDIKEKLLKMFKKNNRFRFNEIFFIELLTPRDDEQYVKFQNYIKALDKKRKKDANEIFGWKIY